MERCEHRSQPFQFTRNVGRVHRLRREADAAGGSRLDFLERGEVRVFISETNLQWWSVSRNLVRFEPFRKIQPWPASARTHINDRAGSCRVNEALQQRDDRPVHSKEVEAKLKRIRNSITNRRWTPRLVMELDQVYAAHGQLSPAISIPRGEHFRPIERNRLVRRYTTDVTLATKR